MKVLYLFATALLGLASAFSAHAQTPAARSLPVAAPASSTAPRTIMVQPVPTSATTPTSPETARPLYTNGVPARDVDAGPQHINRLYGGKAAVSGSHETRSLNRKRTTTQP
ncbi:hypothetical protein [Hymenobacter sp. UV11]|uniref:hypothetical protein n=1 Tax=Hymenobacter sp. UV11 TaxID=1849735 RepID=UPI0010D67613|nr:hypothetical protein [Hymenobacter sp. UV11]TDN37143.1 hypothetical protein A8B98_05295 [Hymenobacter sp. UV11]